MNAIRGRMSLTDCVTALTRSVSVWAVRALAWVAAYRAQNCPPADSRGASEHLAPFVEPYLDDTAGHIVDAVATAADGLAVTPLQVALAWVRDRPGVVAPIIGPRNAQQLTAALSVETLSLPDEICRALDDVSAPVHRYPDQDWSTL